MKNLLVICGPTATGKTSLAINLAKKFNGELISADSRQVYSRMDIGTGKDLPGNSKFQISNFKIQNSCLPAGRQNSLPKTAGRHLRRPKTAEQAKFKIGYYLFGEIPIWLYDVVEPDYRFNVADYVKCASWVIRDIWRRKKLPILVGGTGFYIKALIDGIETLGVPPDWELREKLSSCRVVELSNLLKELDYQRWQKMNESDRNNPRRLIRAIEIAKKIQNSPPKTAGRHLRRPKTVEQAGKIQIPNLKFQNVLFIGLKAPYRVLYERIDRRVEERIKQGVIEEIKKLLKKGYNWENSVLGATIGYREWRPYFINSQFLPYRQTGAIRNSQLKEEIITRWKHNEHAYARRQMTWFKKDKRIHWFDISQKKWQDKIEELVKNWINEEAENS